MCLSVAAVSLVLAACSSYRSGGPASSVCLTVRIDYAGADVYDEITVVKMIDLATGQTVYASWDTALAYDSDGARGSFVQVRECIAAKSTGTKQVIAFYRPGGVEPREECETSGDLFSNRCMPRPGDVVAETYVDIAEGDDLVVKLNMGDS